MRSKKLPPLPDARDFLADLARHEKEIRGQETLYPYLVGRFTGMIELAWEALARGDEENAREVLARAYAYSRAWAARPTYIQVRP